MSFLKLPNVISLSLSFFHGQQGLNVSPMSLTLSPAPFHLRLYGLSTLTVESKRHQLSSFLFQGLCTAAPFSFFRSELKCHILKKGFLTILTHTLNTEVLSHTVLFVFSMICIISRIFLFILFYLPTHTLRNVNFGEWGPSLSCLPK